MPLRTSCWPIGRRPRANRPGDGSDGPRRLRRRSDMSQAQRWCRLDHPRGSVPYHCVECGAGVPAEPRGQLQPCGCWIDEDGIARCRCAVHQQAYDIPPTGKAVAHEWRGTCATPSCDVTLTLRSTKSAAMADWPLEFSTPCVGCGRDLLVTSAGEVPATADEDDDWRRFCVNHEGYSGPMSKCPTCQARV